MKSIFENLKEMEKAQGDLYRKYTYLREKYPQGDCENCGYCESLMCKEACVPDDIREKAGYDLDEKLYFSVDDGNILVEPFALEYIKLLGSYEIALLKSLGVCLCKLEESIILGDEF